MERKRQRLLNGLERSIIIQAFLLVITGCILAVWYKPGSSAYDSVSSMQASLVTNRLAGFHYWGSALLILCSLLLIVLHVFWNGFQSRTRQWYGAIIVFLAAYGGQLTGNLLPMDRHGVQTAVIETGLMQTIPVVGKSMRDIALAGSQFSPASAARWYALHDSLIVLLLALAVFLLWPRKKEAEPDEGISPLATWIPIGLLAVTAIAFAPPLGDMAGTLDYTGYNAFVSWYTWPLHGSLQAFLKVSVSLGWMGYAGLPGLFVLFLLILPFVGKRLKKAASQGIFALFVIFFIGNGLAFGGPIAKLTGNRDPAKSDLTVQTEPELTGPALVQKLALASAGRQLFNSVGCAGCHGENGEQGSVGPTLTNEGGKEKVEWIEEFIRNPQSKQPSSTMPSFPDLSKEDRHKLAEWVSLSPSLKTQVIQGKQ